MDAVNCNRLFFEPGEKTTDPPAQESKITDVDIFVTK